MRTENDPAIHRLLEALQGVLAQAAEPVHVLRTILEQAVTKTEADRGAFVEVASSGKLDYRVLHRFESADLAEGADSFSRTIFAEVLRERKAILIENALDDPRFSGSSSIQELKLVSVLSMPIRVGERIRAIVHLERDRPGHFTPEHAMLLHSLGEVATPVLETLRAGKKVLDDRERLRVTARLFQQELDETREVLSRDWSFGRFLGCSPAVRSLERTALKVAASDVPVLIEGETGTGKSLLARILHHLGPRSKQSFVTVFCPSLERGMVETELFGHRRGAFTGAIGDRIGKVQAAERGTMFLDEVGELPAEIQPKLLRLLHEKAFERVGDPQERRADVRVIAATNKDLAAEVRAGRFRLDLYERLRFFVVRIPPVRERRADIPLLLRHALDVYESGRWIELSAEARSFLVETDHAWSGNVREIEQLAARIALEHTGGTISRNEVEHHLVPANTALDAADPRASLPALVETAERSLLEQALRENPDLSRAQMAAKLGISERALYKKLRVLKLSGSLR